MTNNNEANIKDIQILSNKFYGMIGIARKAGKLVFGYDMAVSLIKSKNAEILVIIASDTSDKTKKNIVIRRYGD